MKKCPTCQKTFDDNMRFCQTDGTPLVEAVEPSDPYKTMVASKDEIAAALGSNSPAGSTPQQDEVLELPPTNDQGRPRFQGGPSSSAGAEENEGQVMEIPPLAESKPAAESKASEPILNPPSFGDISPPPSPFGDQGGQAEGTGYQQTMPPIPSPFGEPEPRTENSSTRSEFAEAETMVNQPPPPFEPYQPASSPLEKASSEPEWTPPPAPDANWQNQPIGQNTPFQPPAAAATGQNKTLPIISLVLGILSLCCYVSPITGIAALVTGFMGIKNIKNDPAHYGGRGLALAGMIIGGLFALIGIVYWVFLLFFGGLSMIMNGLPR